MDFPLDESGDQAIARLGAGIIGLGVGEKHLTAYQEIADVEVHAICDIDPLRLNEIADRYGISNRYTDYRRITENPNIDVVSICSYDDAHAEQAISALGNDKHVMIEKPIALNRRDAEAILRAQQDSGKFLSSNLILRAAPRFIELKRMIDAGEFGEIAMIEGDYLHNILWKITEGWRGQMEFYCVTYGGGIHLIDLMRWLIGREVEEVSGMANKILTRDSNYQFPDLIVNLLRFEGGTIGKTMSNFSPSRTKFHSLNVYGTNKTFVNDIPNAKLFDGDTSENEMAIETDYPGAEKGDLIPDLIAAVRGNREPNIGVRDVFRVMDVCFAAWESIATGASVKVKYLV